MYKLGNKCTNYFTKCFLKYIHNIQEILNVRHSRLKFWGNKFFVFFFKCPLLSKNIDTTLLKKNNTHTHARTHTPRLARDETTFRVT